MNWPLGRKRWIYVGCLMFAAQAWAVTPLIYYVRGIIADSPDLKKFGAAMEYVTPSDWENPVTRIAPTDGSCAAGHSDYPEPMDAEQARTFVEERSVKGRLDIAGQPPPETRWPLWVQLRQGDPPWRVIKEGETMNLKSLRGTPITVRITGGQVMIGRYKARLGFMGDASDGAVVVIEGCGKLD